MDQLQVHYELFVRHTPGAPWKLEMAAESRTQVTEAAEAMMNEGRVAAVRVSKETFDPSDREFQSVTILSRGKVESARKHKAVEDLGPLCITPEDLYSSHARDRIGRLLEGWLARQKATAFELLHSPELVEKLDASGNELQHAVQKIAVPEAQARGVSVHELIRNFQRLIERAVNRVIADGRRGRFPDLKTEPFASIVERVMHETDAAYLIGGAVTGHLAQGATWSEKVMRLLELAEAAPKREGPRRLAFEVLEQPLSEILESRAGLVELLGPGLDPGGQMAGMTWLVASDAVTALVAIEPQVARSLPPLGSAAARLAEWISKPPFAGARAAVGRRILRDLMGPRRLRPASAREEIELLRALGMALTASAGELLPAEGVEEAFAARSRTLVTSEFVDALLGRDGNAREEAELLVWLCENVVGPQNKRQAARYLASHVGSLRFETELRNGADPPGHRLAQLAGFQRSIARLGLIPTDLAPILAKLGEVGGLVEGDVKLTATLAGASAPVAHRLTLLLRLATGEAAPLGPAADRAKLAAMKLLRNDAARAELAAQPDQLAQVRGMIQAAGLAA